MKQIRQVFFALAFLLLSTIGVMAQEPGADDIFFSWSPDGKTLLFMSTRGGTTDLYTIDRNGTGLRALTEGLNINNAKWSPDGQTIVGNIAGDNGGSFRLNVVDLSLTRLFDTSVSAYVWSWSPTGHQIMVSIVGEPGIYDAVLVDVDDTDNRLNLTQGSLSMSAVFWSPDGSQVMVNGKSVVTGLPEVYVYATEDGTRLSDNLLANYVFKDNADYHLAWSPDGKWLAFSTSFDENIYLIDVATGSLRPLAYAAGMVYKLLWTVDSSELVYSLLWQADNTTALYRVKLADRVPQMITPNGSSKFALSPDSTLLLAVSLNGELAPTQFISLLDGYTVQTKSPYTTILDYQWSADGTTLAVSLCADDDYDLFLIDTSSGDMLNMTPEDAFTGRTYPSSCGSYG